MSSPPLPAPSHDQPERRHEIVADGFINFRAVPPLAAADGARLRQDHFFRSGSLRDIGQEGVVRLRSLSVGRVFDLRSGAEISSHPAPFLPADGLDLAAPGHSIRLGALTSVLQDEAMRAEDVRQAMIDVYRDLARHFRPVFAAAIRFAAEPGPFILNCTAGKDRTGATVALILSALGVHRDDILSDYLETNVARDSLIAMLKGRSGGIDYGRVATENLAPLHAADAAYLDAFFATLDAEFGGADAYLAYAAGVDHALRERLCTALLDES